MTGRDEISTSWWPVDLTAALNGDDIPPPSLMTRTDGISMLYPGKIHWFSGESESLKSWAAQLAVVQTIQNKGKVLYVDFEDDDRGLVSRLLSLGLTRQQIELWFEYVRPFGPLTSGNAFTMGYVALEETLENIDEYLELVVIDGVTEAMTLEGLDLNSNADIASWIALLPRKVAKKAAVIVIDHVTKSKETRGRFAIGGQHKLAGIDGVAYGFEVRRPLSRALVEPITGLSTITVHKDRPGYIRSRCKDGIVGTLEITSYPDGGVIAKIASPTELSSAPAIELRVAILDHLATYDGASKSAIEATIGGNAAVTRGAVKWHVDNGHIEVRREGVAHRHYLTPRGRDALAEMVSETP